jgi:hypothetical protein
VTAAEDAEGTVVRIGRETHRTLLWRMANAITHTDSAARRGDVPAIHHHRGYRSGVAETMALLLGEEWAHQLKVDAFEASEGRPPVYASRAPNAHKRTAVRAWAAELAAAELRGHARGLAEGRRARWREEWQ